MSLSERTMAEMRAGARSVGTSEAGIQATITGAQAWKEADAWERLWGQQAPEHTHVHVVAVRDADNAWWLHTSVAVDGKETMTFPPELFVKYPSPTLRAQMALLFG